MSDSWRLILPYVIINVVLVVAAVVLILTGHHVAGLVLMIIDAGNIMVMRWRMFQWQRRRRGR